MTSQIYLSGSNATAIVMGVVAPIVVGAFAMNRPAVFKVTAAGKPPSVFNPFK